MTAFKLIFTTILLFGQLSFAKTYTEKWLDYFNENTSQKKHQLSNKQKEIIEKIRSKYKLAKITAKNRSKEAHMAYKKSWEQYDPKSQASIDKIKASYQNYLKYKHERKTIILNRKLEVSAVLSEVQRKYYAELKRKFDALME